MPPQRILLATDLSCRCDRAQERAARLAEQWGSKLYLLHVVEDEPELPAWRRGRRFRKKLVERELRAITRDRPLEAEMLVRPGRPAQVILQAADPVALGDAMGG